MKRKSRALLTIGGVLIAVAQVQAQFDSGSDESYGPIDILTDTMLDVPADGIFNATTVNIPEGVTLTFRRNSLNTPVYILATGDVVIDGTIDVSAEDGTSILGGRGGPGGFGGGNGGQGPIEYGWGLGPGGGSFNLDGSYATGSSDKIYGGPMLLPLIGGSGGGGGTNFGGGGGGGAILLASNSQIEISGTIDATGGDDAGSAGDGSGGAIRLIAPTVAGDGRLNVRHGGTSTTLGLGWIRIDTLDSSNMTYDIDGPGSLGTNMFVFHKNQPRLDIIEVAGDLIPEGTTESFVLLLPAGSSTLQTVTVQARDFTGIVPVTIALIPSNGERQLVEIEIDMSQGNPASVQTTIDFTATATHIQVWTR